MSETLTGKPAPAGARVVEVLTAGGGARATLPRSQRQTEPLVKLYDEAGRSR